MSKLTDRLLYALTAFVLILVIGGLVLPNITGRHTGAKIKAAESQVDRLAMAVETYLQHTDKTPPALNALVDNTDEAEGWKGPYVKKTF